MGHRLSKIYTRTGDDGSSGLAGGERRDKDDIVFMAMGDIDELNAHIGMIHALLPESHAPNQPAISHTLDVIAHLLFNVGGEIAMPEFVGIEDKHIAYLEAQIDQMNAHLPYLKEFILPKGNVLICQIHIARCVARRAERACVMLKKQQGTLSEQTLAFINRLSDYLFVLARFVTPSETLKETLWNAQILAE